MNTDKRNESDAPDYDVEIDADELLAELVEQAQQYAEDYEEKRQWWYESLDGLDEWLEARHWMEEARGGLEATGEAIAALQPESHSIHVQNCRDEDGTVDVREFLSWLSDESSAAHNRSYGPYTETRHADEAESAYVSVISTVRDDYGVGRPRLDDLGGTPLECDMP